jgi:hypothetical protein
MILAWENPYCVPYVDLGGYTSHPVRANTVVLMDAGPTLEGDFVAVPTFTYSARSRRSN